MKLNHVDYSDLFINDFLAILPRDLKDIIKIEWQL
ncbi:hypothetical protein N483_26340 [Pseudoalteromonas luteoviolacea NCIMB 1944]|uniref:Uncharacterized protein n=1 Tax=Pseudoalteromonas luteoviolacea (strain 2ta16) TaxID=1353533 RepID=V4HTW6_PSEL2|nr:hypothetical protein PL2TA16_01953 [Pseudoalteromonas luteoviolacea 2ta16]KZN33293.1 hypothetical protein N483_26340 [Pseudoalteromonas luteoviolacea NCIMB 1944]